MSDQPEVIAAAPEAPADFGDVDFAAAFASAQPYNPSAEPTQPASVEADAVTASSASVAGEVPSQAPAAVGSAATAPDYAAYLRESFGGAESDAIKAALENAGQNEAYKANQRTAQDVALAKLFEDPKAGADFVRLQSTDFTALSDRELHAAAYAHAHPELKPDVATIRARREYDAEYAAADFDDADDPVVQEAKVLLADARAQALVTMENAKTAARQAVLTAATPEAEGPTAEQVQAQAAQEAHGTAWVNGIENVINAPSLELAYQVDGQEVKLAFDHKNAAFQEFMEAPAQWLEKAIGFDPKNPTATNFDRLAEIGAWLTQPDVMLKNTLSVGKSSLGAVIPLNAAVNPIPNAPQATGGEMTLEDAFRQAAAKGRNTSY